MQTHNLKLPKNYRDAASDFYIKVGIGLIAVLIILNLLQLFLFLKETKNLNGCCAVKISGWFIR